MNGQGTMVGGKAGMTFYHVGMQLSSEMVDQLTVEHARETKAIFKQVEAYKNELARCAELMQGFINREKALDEMMNKIQETYSQATSHFADMHGKFGEMTSGHGGMPDPIKDVQVELQSINRLLSTPAVPPPEVPPHLSQLIRTPTR